MVDKHQVATKCPRAREEEEEGLSGVDRKGILASRLWAVAKQCASSSTECATTGMASAGHSGVHTQPVDIYGSAPVSLTR